MRAGYGRAGAGSSSEIVLTIDLHTHLLPESWPDLASRYGYGGWVALEHHAPCRARMLVDGTGFREIGGRSRVTPVLLAPDAGPGAIDRVLSP